MSNSLVKLIQILISITLLITVAWWVGLFTAEGQQQFVELIANADPLFLAASIAIGVVVNMSSSLKWWMLARARALNAGYWRVFSYYVVGQFYNLFLPTSVGGDVVRSYELGKFTGRQADALASVFVERYTGVLMLLALAGIAVLSQLSVFNTDYVWISLAFFTLVLGFIAWMIFDPRLYHWFRDRMIGLVPKTARLFAKLDRLLESVQVYGQHRSALFWAFVNSLVFYFLAVVNVYLTARVFAIDVEFWHMLAATPIIMLIMNFPFSLGNWGLMEAAYLGVFQLMGYPPSLGLSVALLMRVKSLIDGAMGGVLHPLFVTGNFTKK